MFEDSMFESQRTLDSRHRWPTAVSFGAQMVLGAAVVLVSLLYTDALPNHSLISRVEAPPPIQSAPTSNVVKLTRPLSNFRHDVLTLPTKIPNSIAIVHDPQPVAENTAQAPFGVAYGVANAAMNPTIADLLREEHPIVPGVAAQRVHVSSGVIQGLLIHLVKPQYPLLAKQARIQGTVVLQAVIGKDGNVQELRIVSGHPLLAAAALEAVKQWHYQPYYLNGVPVAVDTQINLNFTLASE